MPLVTRNHYIAGNKGPETAPLPKDSMCVCARAHITVLEFSIWEASNFISTYNYFQPDLYNKTTDIIYYLH